MDFAPPCITRKKASVAPRVILSIIQLYHAFIQLTKHGYRSSSVLPCCSGTFESILAQATVTVLNKVGHMYKFFHDLILTSQLKLMSHRILICGVFRVLPMLSYHLIDYGAKAMSITLRKNSEHCLAALQKSSLAFSSSPILIPLTCSSAPRL